jgi:hypothetical protein
MIKNNIAWTVIKWGTVSVFLLACIAAFPSEIRDALGWAMGAVIAIDYFIIKRKEKAQ